MTDITGLAAAPAYSVLRNDDANAESLALIAKYLGAMDSTLTMMLRLMAADRQIPVEWHDPTIEPFPFKGEHGKPAVVETIKLGMPYDRRKG